ncbi:MAG: hypothetical protein ACYC9L_04120, partial [Sulfuricaulis sp.]
ESISGATLTLSGVEIVNIRLTALFACPSWTYKLRVDQRWDRPVSNLIIIKKTSDTRQPYKMRTGVAGLSPTKAVGVIRDGDNFPRTSRSLPLTEFPSPLALFLFLSCFFLGLFLGCHDELLW